MFIKIKNFNKTKVCKSNLIKFYKKIFKKLSLFFHSLDRRK